MGKYVKNRAHKPHKWILAGCLVVVLGLLALFVMPQVLYMMNEEPDLGDFTQTTAPQDPNEESDPGDVTATQEQNEETQMQTQPGSTAHELESAVEFPVALAEGNIEIESLFQFSGVNPDAENQQATDVASIVLRNTSGKYLREATVSATLANGTELTFVVGELPVGASVMAFSIDNERLLETDLCADITAQAVFEEVSDHDGIEFAVAGMSVTVTNTSSEDLNELDVYYRDVFSDRYFGGKTYIYNIEHISAGESMTFTAEESLLGVIEVVRVAVNDKN